MKIVRAWSKIYVRKVDKVRKIYVSETDKTCATLRQIKIFSGTYTCSYTFFFLVSKNKSSNSIVRCVTGYLGRFVITTIRDCARSRTKEKESDIRLTSKRDDYIIAFISVFCTSLLREINASFAASLKPQSYSWNN